MGNGVNEPSALRKKGDRVFPNAIALGRGTYTVRVSIAVLNRGLRDLLDRGALLTSVSSVQAGADLPIAEPETVP